MPRFDTAKKLGEMKTRLDEISKQAGNQAAISFLQDMFSVLEEMHFRLAACEKEFNPPDSFIHDEGPHRLR